MEGLTGSSVRIILFYEGNLMSSNAGGIPASDASSLKSKFHEGRKKRSSSRKTQSVLHPDGGGELCAAERMRLPMRNNEKGSSSF